MGEIFRERMKGNTDEFIVQQPEGNAALHRLKVQIEIMHLVWALMYVDGFA
jgi:hypothetical protein